MKKVCAFCNKVFGKKKEKGEKTRVTMCNTCEKQFLKDIKEENDNKNKEN